MLSLLKSIPMILASQVMAPVMALDVPVFTKLTVTSAKHYEEEFYEMDDEGGNLIKIPIRTLIDIKSEHDSFSITINESTGELMYFSSPGSYLGSGSAEMGIALMGLPGLILASPVLIAAHVGWKTLQVMTGMERHAWAVWRGIKDQLEPKEYLLLEAALLKYNGFIEKKNEVNYGDDD